jgi:formylglycine-generating enzyme required for sulfatase activity
MPPSSTKPFSGIFVSYRRDDSSGHAGRLSDRLVEHFGRDRIFMDIDTIEPGEDFVTVIEDAVGSCEILIAIIGRNWLSGTGGTTGRLDNPNDFVRLEIAAALRRDIRVIPVLVQRASMPKQQDLPEDLVKLTRRNAVELSDLRWQNDVDQLIAVMERLLVKRAEAERLAQAAKQSEDEQQRREGEEKRRVEEQLLAEEEGKLRAEGGRVQAEQEADHRRREAEGQARAAQERERREQVERQKREAAGPTQRLEEEERQEERLAAETRLSKSDLSARDRQLDEPSTAITAGTASRAHKNRRLVLIAVATLIVLVVSVAVIWRTQRGSNSSGETKQAAATQTPPAKVSQTPAPAKPRAKLGEIVQNQMGMQLVYVPAGSFTMGENADNLNIAKPLHQVTFKDGFYIGKYEVTQAQWQAVMGNNPSNFKDCGVNCPVENVSWEDAQSFIDKLNERNDEFSYRLPTEAEWEYACRAGTTGAYAGDLGKMAWYFDNAGRRTHAVGGKRPNDWGLADMHGNVREWCQDWYHETYDGAPTDGSAWLSVGSRKTRVVRGGSWDFVDTLLTSAARDEHKPTIRYQDIGFRLVAVVRSP